MLFYVDPGEVRVFFFLTICAYPCKSVQKSLTSMQFLSDPCMAVYYHLMKALFIPNIYVGAYTNIPVFDEMTGSAFIYINK